MVIALPNPGGKRGNMARHNGHMMTYRKRRNAAHARKNSPKVAARGRVVKKAAALWRKLGKPVAWNTVFKDPEKFLKKYEGKSPTKRRKKAASKPPSPPSNGTRKRKRRRTARSLVSSAKLRIGGRRKRVIKSGKNAGQVKKGTPSVATDLRRVARRIDTSNKDLAKAMREMAKKKDGRRKARKNPSGKEIGLGALGFVGGYLAATGLVGGARKLGNLAGGSMGAKGAEIGIPVIGSVATYYLHTKGLLGLASKTVAFSVIGGMVSSAVVRNVPAIRNALSGNAILGPVVNFGQDSGPAFGAYHMYAGAAGVGRYVTDPYDGMGRYMLDDTAFQGMSGAHDVMAGAAGVGEYVSEPINSLGGHGARDDDMQELMDDLGAIPALTPDEEQAENILIPELAYEALQGYHGALGQDPKATIRARTSAPIVRATPSVAAQVEDYNIGEVIGPSEQVPGTVLVATTVAGRDIIGGAGPMIPTQRGAFKNKAIEPAKNITTSPYGVFSRGIFSSTLPVHGAISR